MTLYDDRLTLRARPLTDTDFANLSGSITVSRAGMGNVTYSFAVGDFLCSRQVGTVRDMWVEPNATFASSGWFPVCPPDDHGYVQYGGKRISDVTDLDNGYFQCSVGCLVDYATFADSHVLVHAQTWYDQSYHFKKAITIDHTKVIGGSDLTNFPLLVSLTDTDLRTASHGGSVQSASGYDIVFVDSTETIKLDHEIESYTGTSGAIVMWVRLPTLSASQDTIIYCYYDNNAIVASQENVHGVWDAHYSGVWHLGDGATLALTDSTTNGNNGSNSGATALPGIIGGAAHFNGASLISVPNAADLNYTTGDQLTFSAWCKRDTTAVSHAMISQGGWTGGAGRAYQLNFSDGGGNCTVNGLAFNYTTPSLVDAYGTTTLYTDTTNWHYYTLTLTMGTGSTAVFSVDGSVDATATWRSGTGNVASAAPNASIVFGGNAVLLSNYLTGALDELRMSKGIARTAGWSTTEYNNQSSPATFFTVGTAQGG